VTELAGRIRAIPTWQVTLGLALFALGFLIAAQLAAEGPRVRYTTQERSPLVGTALELQRQQDELRAQIDALGEQIQGLQDQGEGTTAIVRERDRVQPDGLDAGGPGGRERRRLPRHGA
jgi:cell division protein FtsB